MTEHRDRLPTGVEKGRAVLLPGRGYTPAMPLLAMVSDLLVDRGWAVREVWWTVPEGMSPRRTAAWVDDQARAAADGWSDRPLLVGKSLGTFATAYAADAGLDAAWLTPLLGERRVVKGIRRNRGRQLLVGGSVDEAWVPLTAASLPAEVLELPDADHGLAVKGDRLRTAAHRERLRDALGVWLAGS